MKILFFSQYYYPETVGPMEICQKLVSLGNEVTVVTGLPNYPEGKVPKKYKYFKNRNEIINGVKVKRTFEISRRKGKVWLALNYLSYLISASCKAIFLKNDFDIVFCYQLSPVTVGIPTILYSKLKRKKCILYCLDIWPESVKVIGIKENTFIFKIINKISRFVYRKVDKILVSSKYFEDYISKQHKIEKINMEYLPQASIDFGTIEKSKSNYSNITNFTFAGNCGYAQNIEMVLKAIKYLKEVKKVENDYIFNIAGTGTNLENLKRYCIVNNISSQVKFWGFLNKEEVIELYNQSDVTIITLSNSSDIGKTLPLKFISYLSVGKPIIAAIDGAVSEIVETEKLGITVKPDDYIKLANIMLEFINKEEDYSEYGKNARKYYEEHFTIEKHIENLNKNIKLILGGKKDV